MAGLLKVFVESIQSRAHKTVHEDVYGLPQETQHNWTDSWEGESSLPVSFPGPLTTVHCSSHVRQCWELHAAICGLQPMNKIISGMQHST